jgi:nicotinamide phosphoribosyltransferase
LLDSHIGVIYGDSITQDRAREIIARLRLKGFASQVVFGIGSYTYQANTRDTFGTAIKATWVQINGEGRAISKNPITDDGTKRSAYGFLRVDYTTDGFVLKEDVSASQETRGSLRTVFNNGLMYNIETLWVIRDRLQKARY